jgi:hypothetical protein
MNVTRRIVPARNDFFLRAFGPDEHSYLRLFKCLRTTFSLEINKKKWQYRPMDQRLRKPYRQSEKTVSEDDKQWQAKDNPRHL